jgi:hypothetical protein
MVDYSLRHRGLEHRKLNAGFSVYSERSYCWEYLPHFGSYSCIQLVAKSKSSVAVSGVSAAQRK